MAGSLYVVSTPIGNLDDITVRALNTLKSVGLVAAEDTRRTGLLLRHFGIATPTTSLHEHNENQKVPALLRKLRDGSDIAVVSDAGTPLVADPGQRLIAAAIAEGMRVVPVPGTSAVLAALAASGYPPMNLSSPGSPRLGQKTEKNGSHALPTSPGPWFSLKPHTASRKTILGHGRYIGRTTNNCRPGTDKAPRGGRQTTAQRGRQPPNRRARRVYYRPRPLTSRLQDNAQPLTIELVHISIK